MVWVWVIVACVVDVTVAVPLTERGACCSAVVGGVMLVFRRSSTNCQEWAEKPQLHGGRQEINQHAGHFAAETRGDKQRREGPPTY